MQRHSNMTDLLSAEPALSMNNNGGQRTHLVLIVDDDLVTMQILDGMLRKAGFETQCANNLADAEVMINSYPISLILLDINLPDGMGLDLCRKLSSQPVTAQIPVLFISSNMDVATKVAGFAAGGIDYITKPLAVAEVLARVRTHLRLRAAYESLTKLHLEHVERLAASQKLLMPQPKDVPAACFQVCIRQVNHAGGDFYDVLQAGNNIIDYVVADASGHDLSASLWTASFKTVLSEYGSILYTPEDICRKINHSLSRLLPEGAYFSVIYARLNRSNRTLTLINAGHPSAILVSGMPQQSCVLHQEGDLVGIFSDTVFGKMEIAVQPGDRLFLYSDGLAEMDGSRQIGIEWLRKACQATVEMPLDDAVEAIVETICAGRSPEDDVILMGICI